jgi:hypothetical protein
LPCPNGTKGIIVEIDLPNHVKMHHHRGLVTMVPQMLEKKAR